MTEPLLQDELLVLRQKLGLTRHAMAELLYTHQQTYRGWEEGAKPHSVARDRIRKFIDSANKQLAILDEKGFMIDDLIPLNLASAILGIPVESAFRAYRHGAFEGTDLGILGVWVYNDTKGMAAILDAVTE